MKRLALTMCVVVGMSVATSVEGQGNAPGLEGAWRVAEFVGADATRAPEPGLLLFVGRHYSYTLVTSEGPRPGVSGGLTTAESLLAAWNPFTANAGTFEISGSTMIRRPIVAKSPDAMGAGIFNEYTFRLSADTLWTTTVGTESGPARTPATVRYVRVR